MASTTLAALHQDSSGSSSIKAEILTIQTRDTRGTPIGDIHTTQRVKTSSQFAKGLRIAEQRRTAANSGKQPTS